MIYYCSLSGEEKKEYQERRNMWIEYLLVCSHLAFSSLIQFRILFLGNGATNNGIVLAISINNQDNPHGSVSSR